MLIRYKNIQVNLDMVFKIHRGGQGNRMLYFYGSNANNEAQVAFDNEAEAEEAQDMIEAAINDNWPVLNLYMWQQERKEAGK